MSGSVDEVPPHGRYMVSQRREDWKTLSGLELDLESTPSTLEQLSILPEDLGGAGRPPYTRGIHSTMYRSRLWTSLR